MLAAAVAAVERGDAAPACTITWDGGGATTAWATGANWDTNVLPTTSDLVCVPNLGAGVEVVHSTGTDSITSLQGAGGVQISGGTLDVSGTADPIDELVVSGGSLTGTGTVRVGTTGTWSGGAMTGAGATAIDPGATVTLSGSASLGDGRILDVGGTFALAGDFSLFSTGTPGLVHVLATGVVRKTAGVGASSINPPIDNDGTVEATTGAGSSLSLAGGSGSATSTGSFGKATAAGNVRFSAGSHTIGPATLAGGVQLTGATISIPTGTVTVGQPTATLVLEAGRLQGSGNIAGNVVNDGGIVGPGNSPGVLTIDGAFTQSAGGTLETEIAGASVGTGYDRVAVGGTATLAGTLTIITPGSFDPPASSTYDVLTADARQGTFDTISGAALTGEHYEADYQPDRLRLFVVSDGSAQPPTNTVPESAPPPPTLTPAAPQPGTVDASPVTGKVLVRPPGSSKFAAMRGAVRLRKGAVVDVCRGRIAFVAIGPAGAPAPRGEFHGGVFALIDTGSATRPPRLRLADNDPCGHARTQRLWTDASGSFQVVGHYGSATNTATRWRTEDRRRSTSFTVRHGVIRVRRTGSQRSVRVAAGHTYVIRARR
jgi:hypothetical protein